MVTRLRVGTVKPAADLMIKRDASGLRPLLPGPVPWQLNETGARKVPADAPASFVPARYAEYPERPGNGADETAFRHHREQCVVLALRDGLRPGDVFVLETPGGGGYGPPLTNQP